MKLMHIVFIVTLIGLVSTQIAIPLRPNGYGIGGLADSDVVIEMFFDPLCPDSQASWPTVLQLIQVYGVRIHFRIHTFPLPYHPNAFIASQGLHVIANITHRNAKAIYKYTTAVFENQHMWYREATKSMTMPQIIDSLAAFTAGIGFVSKEQFINGMNSDDINYQTRLAWKYACSRAITGTPTFLINGVSTSADATWSLAHWMSVIDPILKANVSMF